MRQEVIVKNIYTFDELSESVQREVIDNHINNLEISDFICVDEYIELVKVIEGLTTNLRYEYNINPFPCCDDYVEVYIKNQWDDSEVNDLKGVRALAWLENNFFCYCNRHHRVYSKSKNKIINKSKLEWNDWMDDCPFTGTYADGVIKISYNKFISNVRNKKDDAVRNFFNILSKEILKELQECMEGERSEEYIKEFFIENGTEFLEDGTIY